MVINSDLTNTSIDQQQQTSHDEKAIEARAVEQECQQKQGKRSWSNISKGITSLYDKGLNLLQKKLKINPKEPKEYPLIEEKPYQEEEENSEEEEENSQGEHEEEEDNTLLKEEENTVVEEEQEQREMSQIYEQIKQEQPQVIKQEAEFEHENMIEMQVQQPIIRVPIERSKFYETSNNLDIYFYPKISMDDLSEFEKSQLKVIMMIGQTGSGKSTLIDTMCNFLSGIQFDDPFRYKLVDESEQISKNKQCQSLTKTVSYYIMRPNKVDGINFPVLLVDTPGFLDTEGIKKDDKTKSLIQDFFEKEIDQIHSVCFVSNSSQSRLTCSQIYVFNRVLELFGKDIEENFANLLTFCDGKPPVILSALEAENVPTKFWYKINNSGIFSKTGDEFDEIYWRIGIRSLAQYFNDFEMNFTAKSLKLSKEVLQERKKLQHIVINIQPIIDTGLMKAESLRTELEYFQQHEDSIKQNENFSYEYSEERFRKINLAPGINTTACRNCNRTCHFYCRLSDDEQKSRCISMMDGHCTVCPNKCHWSDHSNIPFFFEYYTHTETRTYEDLMERYIKAQSQQSIESDQILEGLSKDLQVIKKEVYDNFESLSSSIIRLQEIALRPNSYSSIEILEQMIQNEQNNQKQGYLMRIEGLNSLKKQYKILNSLSSDQKERYLNEQFSDYQSTFSKLKEKKNINICSIF